MELSNVTEVVHITSKDQGKCKRCNFSPDNFESRINHLIHEHEYKLKFIGTETDSSEEKLPFHYTIAILAK